MPILPSPDPQTAMQPQSDLGLEYLKSQQWWPFRGAYYRRFFDSFTRAVSSRRELQVREKRYLLAAEVPIQSNWNLLSRIRLLDCLTLRRTSRHLSGRPLDFAELGTWLMASFGPQRQLPHPPVGREWQRTLPSPGGLFSTEIYFLALNIDGLARGLYHFCGERGVFEVLPWSLSPIDIDSLYPDPTWRELKETASGVVFLSAVFARSKVKYHSRYLRFALLEAGAVMQNLDLVAAALRIGIFHQGSVHEGSVDRLLRLDGESEAVIHSAIVLDCQR